MVLLIYDGHVYDNWRSLVWVAIALQSQLY